MFKKVIFVAVFALLILTVYNVPVDLRSSDSQRFRFVVMADSRGNDRGINSIVIGKVLDRIKRLNPQPKFAVIPGDLIAGAKTYTGVKTQFEYFKKEITKYYPMSFYYLGIGNHETYCNSGGERAFKKVFFETKANFLKGYSNTVYYFDYSNSRFFMLDSDYPGELQRISPKQLDFVKKNTDNGKNHHFFFFHEPSYPTGYKIGQSLDRYRKERNELWDLIDATKGSIVFVGHEHFYSRRHIDANYNEVVSKKLYEYEHTVYQVTVGGFGGPLKGGFVNKVNVDVPPVAKYSYAVVDVDGKKFTVTAYDLDWNIIDQFSQTH
jgi:3',5'-cyclic-AMP phosphodiesterase